MSTMLNAAGAALALLSLTCAGQAAAASADYTFNVHLRTITACDMDACTNNAEPLVFQETYHVSSLSPYVSLPSFSRNGAGPSTLTDVNPTLLSASGYTAADLTTTGTFYEYANFCCFFYGGRFETFAYRSIFGPGQTDIEQGYYERLTADHGGSFASEAQTFITPTGLDPLLRALRSFDVYVQNYDFNQDADGNVTVSKYFEARGTAYYTGGIPEPSTWALSILGFGLAGAALRRRRADVARA